MCRGVPALYDDGRSRRSASAIGWSAGGGAGTRGSAPGRGCPPRRWRRRGWSSCPPTPASRFLPGPRPPFRQGALLPTGTLLGHCSVRCHVRGFVVWPETCKPRIFIARVRSARLPKDKHWVCVLHSGAGVDSSHLCIDVRLCFLPPLPAPPPPPHPHTHIHTHTHHTPRCTHYTPRMYLAGSGEPGSFRCSHHLLSAGINRVGPCKAAVALQSLRS